MEEQSIKLLTQKNTSPNVLEKTEGMESYEFLYINAEIINHSKYNLTLKNHSLSWGKWITEPLTIQKNTTGKFNACGRDSALSGTEGKVSFICDSNESQKFDIEFNVPLIGVSYIKETHYYPPLVVLLSTEFVSHGSIKATITVYNS